MPSIIFAGGGNYLFARQIENPVGRLFKRDSELIGNG